MGYKNGYILCLIVVADITYSSAIMEVHFGNQPSYRPKHQAKQLIKRRTHDEILSQLNQKLKKLKVEQCFCPLDYEPVCDSDGRTHFNKLCFGCNIYDRKTRIVHDGECDSEDLIKPQFNKDPYSKKQFNFPCVCPKVESPVCDTDGDTHYNIGCMKCAKPRASISKFGACDGFLDGL